MKTSHIVSFLLVVAMLLCGALSCTDNAGGGRTGKTVAYSSVGDSNSWFIAFSAELKAEAAKRGYRFHVTHAQSDAAKQIDDVEDIIAQQPDYLILGPKDVEASAPALAIAKKAHIPVIVVNRDIVGKPGEDYVTKIYSDL